VSKTGRALLRGGSLRLLSLGGSLILQMAMLPFILRTLGPHFYGIWAVVGAATGYYGLLDLGVSSAITRFVSREIGRNNLAGAAHYIAASKRVFRWTALGVALLSVAISFFGSQFIERVEDREVFSLTVLITGMGIALAFPARVHSGILAADLRHDVFAALSLGSNILRAVATYFVLSRGHGLIGLALVNSGISVLQALATVFATRKLCGHIPSVKLEPAGTMRELFGYAGFTMVSQLADFARFKIHPLTISAFLRFSDAIHDRIQNVVVSACTSVLSMLSPVFSRQEGRKDEAGIRQLFLFAYKVSCYTGTFLLGALAIVAPAFVERWLGAGNEIIVDLLYIRVMGALCGIIQLPSVSLLFGASENRFYAKSNTIHAVITLTSTILLVQQWGLMGVVIGVSATTAIMKTFVQAAVACKVAKISLLDLHLKHTLPNLARVFAFLIPVAYAGRYWLTPSWPSLIAFGAVVAPLFAAYIFFIGFNTKERDVILRSAGLRKKPNVLSPPVT
jgi:O-antigen/teichoic acid export membrane protein